MIDRLRRTNPLPEGAIPVAVGLGVSGVGIYVLFAVTSHVLDDADYSALVVLWTLVFALGNGVMQPLEQEVARAVSDRRARGIGSAPIVHRAVLAGLVFTAVLWILSLVASSWLIDELFSGNAALFGAFLIGLLGFCVGHLVRGTLSSHGRFAAYGSFFGLEGAIRPAAAAALAVAGVAAVGAYGFVIVLAPFLAAVLPMRGTRKLLEPGPEAPWSELSANLGWLLLGTVSIALLLNGGAIAVELLADDGQEAAAGVFQNGLFIARVPLFLFQAVLAALLPRLSHQLGRGAFDEFASAVSKLLIAIAVFGIVAVVAAAAVGPAIVGALFGSDQVLESADLGLLAAASIVYMAAVTLSQALIALNGHARMAVGAFLGFVAFLAVTALGSDLFQRVEMGLLVGSTVTAVWTGVFVVAGLRTRRRTYEIDLAEVAADLPLQP